jgi:hypothetical protein
MLWQVEATTLSFQNSQAEDWKIKKKEETKKGERKKKKKKKKKRRGKNYRAARWRGKSYGKRIFPSLR